MRNLPRVASASYFLGISLLATSLLAQTPPPPPPCPPPTPLPSLAIPYTGLTSGCTNQPASPPCIVGETVQFKVGDGVSVGCEATYSWQFETATVSGLATMNHQFSTAGVYNVTLRIIDRFGTVDLAQVVTVASTSAVPTLGHTSILMLIVTIVIIAFLRLR